MERLNILAPKSTEYQILDEPIPYTFDNFQRFIGGKKEKKKKKKTHFVRQRHFTILLNIRTAGFISYIYVYNVTTAYGVIGNRKLRTV